MFVLNVAIVENLESFWNLCNDVIDEIALIELFKVDCSWTFFIKVRRLTFNCHFVPAFVWTKSSVLKKFENLLKSTASTVTWKLFIFVLIL